MTRLVLNMIVKNEADRIERCLRSVLPWVHTAAITDTGSTDNTMEIADRVCKEFGVIPCILETAFEDFSSTRNVSLAGARMIIMPGEYIFLCDADMELVAEPGWADNLTAPAYRMEQRTGGMVYENVRLLRADAIASYKGRTHEVLHVEGAELLKTAYFIDHADGANRPGKLERDITLLQQDMQDDPADPRPVFYLANSHRDLGLHGVAASLYDRRAAMGGWDEEVFVSKLYAGRCYLEAGQEALGITRLLEAHSARPSRAEPLWSLARHFRCKPDQQAAALLFAQKGLTIPQPPDTLFVEKAVYDYELKRELSICANYSADPAVKRDGFLACDWLATSRSVPADVRQEARNNLYWYTVALEDLFPGARRMRVNFPNPVGWWAMNASILRHNEKILLLQRVCNFKVDKVSGVYTMPDGITRTRNFLCELDPDDYSIFSMKELRIDPEPPVEFPWVLGFEDMRLYPYEDGSLWMSATTRQLAPDGLCEIVHGRIDGDRVVDWSVISHRSAGRNEKNWQPFIVGGHLWQYLHDPDIMRSMHGHAYAESHFSIDNFRGSSQLIPDRDGWIWVEHEVVEAWGPRKYLHRFVSRGNGEDEGIDAFTLPFHFAPLAANGNQFTCGIMDDGWANFVVPYSLNDEESWLAFIPKLEVYEALRR